MRGLIQRVSEAKVVVDGVVTGEIGRGILLLLGVERDDTPVQADKLLHKVLNYRIFPDSDAKMNLNVGEAGGGLLVVSQFTLAADTAKGLRPGFSTAGEPALARQLYDYFVAEAAKRHAPVQTGVFAADMKVGLVNDGPVTFLLQT